MDLQYKGEKVNPGDYLHRQMMIQQLRSHHTTRDTYKDYPDLQAWYDEYKEKQQKEKERLRSFAKPK